MRWAYIWMPDLVSFLVDRCNICRQPVVRKCMTIEVLCENYL